MLAKTLNHFSHRMTFREVQLADASDAREATRELIRLLRAGHPILALVQSNALWPSSGLGLHWVVVRGFKNDHVVINDSADQSRERFPLRSFLEAWRLDAMYRYLPELKAYSAVVADAPLAPQYSSISSKTEAL